MTTLAKEKKKRALPLTQEQRQKAVEAMIATDLSAWVAKLKVKEAREQIEKKLGFQISVREFKDLRIEVCQWFRARRQPRTSGNVAGLTDDGWVNLRNAVKQLKAELHGRTLKEAVAIVGTICPTNEIQLNGLTSEFRVWGKPAAK